MKITDIFRFIIYINFLSLSSTFSSVINSFKDHLCSTLYCTAKIKKNVNSISLMIQFSAIELIWLEKNKKDILYKSKASKAVNCPNSGYNKEQLNCTCPMSQVPALWTEPLKIRWKIQVSVASELPWGVGSHPSHMSHKKGKERICMALFKSSFEKVNPRTSLVEHKEWGSRKHMHEPAAGASRVCADCTHNAHIIFLFGFGDLFFFKFPSQSLKGSLTWVILFEVQFTASILQYLHFKIAD